MVGDRPASWPAWLFRIGLLIFALGAAGDFLHHLLPGIAAQMTFVLGSEGERAHLITLVGMLVVAAALFALAANDRAATAARRARRSPGDPYSSNSRTH
ncbi:MAG: hypothetical protein M9890_04620 [Thermomicrobiales bacterium]|nr:hypothetical protein [Thermomicrobiales bacterium]